MINVDVYKDVFLMGFNVILLGDKTVIKTVYNLGKYSYFDGYINRTTKKKLVSTQRPLSGKSSCTVPSRFHHEISIVYFFIIIVMRLLLFT